MSSKAEKIRVMNGLSKKEMANKLHVTEQTINIWEREGIPRQTFPIIQLAKLGAKFNLTIEEEDMSDGTLQA